MATIREIERKGGKFSYNVQIRLGGSPPVSATFKRKTDAKKWAVQTEAAIREGKHFPNRDEKRRTVSELIERYVSDELASEGEAAQRDKGAHLVWWANHIGHRKIADLSHVLISEARSTLGREKTRQGKQRSRSTRNRYVSSLSCVCEKGIEWGLLPSNPCRLLKREKEPPGRTAYLSVEEIHRLIEESYNINSIYLELVIILAVATAMRKSEIMGLRWKDVVLDFAKRNGKDVGRISLSEKRTKTQKARVVYIHGPVLEKLREHAKRRFMKTDLLFPSTRDLESDRPASIRTAFETACKKAELPDAITFHSLRHSALSHAAMSGSTMRDVMQQGGHTSPAVAARYQHLSTEHMTEVSGRLNDAIFGPLDDTEASGTGD